jgi:hypothetical protein
MVKLKTIQMFRPKNWPKKDPKRNRLQSQDLKRPRRNRAEF